MCSNWLTPAIILKFRPYRKMFVLIATVSLLFSMLIIVENVVFVAVNNKQHALLLLLPYFLSWILVILGCIFARIAYLLHTKQIKRFVAVRSHSPSAWSIDSRPPSPSGSSASLQEPFNASYTSGSYLFSHSLTVPHSPFLISDGVQRYHDAPPSYQEVVSCASPHLPVERSASTS